MSQPQGRRVEMQQAPQTMNKDQFTNQLFNAKTRISRRKGELSDGLSDVITQEFTAINQVVLQLFQDLEVKQVTIEELKKQVVELSKGKKLPTLETEVGPKELPPKPSAKK